MFKYIDLEDLKIKDTTEPFTTISISCPIASVNGNMKELKEQIDTAISSIQPATAGWRFKGKKYRRNRPTLVYIKIEAASAQTEEENDAIMETLTNIISTSFFNYICLDTGRPRERRLDVPEELKVANVSLSALKHTVNAATIMDCFDLMIAWTTDCFDYEYDLLRSPINA